MAMNTSTIFCAIFCTTIALSNIAKADSMVQALSQIEDGAGNQSISLSNTQVVNGYDDYRTATTSVNYDDGTLRASIVSNKDPSVDDIGFGGPGIASANLGTSLYIVGPVSTGVMTITMHLDGSYIATPYVNSVNVLSPSYYEIHANIALNGVESRFDVVSGQLYQAQSGLIDHALTVTIPFSTDTQLSLDAQLYLRADNDVNLDFFHTATFSVDVPEGDQVVSDLHFSALASVPEPRSIVLMLAGVGALFLLQQKKTPRVPNARSLLSFRTIPARA